MYEEQNVCSLNSYLRARLQADAPVHSSILHRDHILCPFCPCPTPQVTPVNLNGQRDTDTVSMTSYYNNELCVNLKLRGYFQMP